MSRRRFVRGAGLASLGLLAGCGRLPGQAAGPPKVARLGLFHVGIDHVPPHLPGLQEGLQALGYVEGQNIEYDWRNQVDEEAARATAVEFVRERKDLIVAFETEAARAARATTSEIPVVFLSVDNPVAAGLVQSIAHPGGNMTGMVGRPLLLGKRLELFKELVPSLDRLLALIDPGDPDTPPLLDEAQTAARSLGVQLVERVVRGQTDIPVALASTAQSDVQGVMMISTRVLQFGSAIVRASLEKGLPLGAHSRRMVTEGALFAYGPNMRETGRAAARQVDRILKGARPADIPVEDRDVLEFIVNLKTAETLGLTIPEQVLRLQVTEVIQ